jgi:hypothetical protein
MLLHIKRVLHIAKAMQDYFLPAPNFILPLKNFLDVGSVNVAVFVDAAGYLIDVISEAAE